MGARFQRARRALAWRADLGAALIVVGLLIASALMACVSDVVALVGFSLSAVIGLYMIWRIIRTLGEF